MEAKNQRWPMEPVFDGFFSTYEKLPAKSRSIVEPSTGAVIRYSVSRNQYEEASPVIRRIVGCVTLPGDQRPACWLEFDLIADGGAQVSDIELYEACDSISSALEKLASSLIGTCDGDIGEVVCIGPILHFDRAEVRSGLRGGGLGMIFARCMVAELEERYDPALLVLGAFPLQFEGCAPDPAASAAERSRYDDALAASKQKLAGFYERELGVVRLGRRSDYWGSALSGCELTVHGGVWGLG